MMAASSISSSSSPNPIHLVGYKQRHCTDIFCLFLFGGFLLIYGFICILAISQGNPAGLIQPSDSQGNICGEGTFASQPYELYFDMSKCLTDEFDCPTTKLCVSVCPKEYTHFRLLQAAEDNSQASKVLIRQQLVCVYNFDPISDNRTIIQLVTDGLCAPYTIPSESLLGRCLPTILSNLFNENNETSTTQPYSIDTVDKQAFQINRFSDVGRVMLSDLVRVKESFALFVLVGCVLVLLYMFAVRQLASLVVLLSIILFLSTLFVFSAFCWYTVYTGQDFVYEYSTVAQIVNDFIQLRTIYTIVGSITTFLFLLSSFIIYCLYDRVKLGIILLEQAGNAIFSVLTTLLWSPTIIVLFLILTAAIIYIEMCLSTVGKPIFGTVADNRTVLPCLPTVNNWTQCQFLKQYGYNDLTFEDTDRVTRGVVEFLVDNQQALSWLNRFAYLWLATFLFAFEEIVLAGVFSNYYWSNERTLTYFPLLYSIATIIRYHLGSIAFGSLLLAILRYIRMILDYINKKLSNINRNIVLEFFLKCFSCCLWIFEKFLKFLNKNAYVLIASRGYSFCKATRKAFMYVVNNCLRFLVIVHLTEWILFCGTISVCTINAYLFYEYLQWREEFDQLTLRWIPITVLVLITYLIASVFFSVYDMAIKTLFVCFLQDLEENDGSAARPYAMNDELLRLVHKTNVEK